MKRKMIIILSVLLSVVILITVWFKIPFSPLRREFDSDVRRLIEEGGSYNGEVFSEEDFEDLPGPVRDYLISCGYVGQTKMSCLNMEYRGVDFKLGRDKPKVTIDYSQYDFVRSPSRLAYINTSMYGIPFCGYDYYEDGKGGMKGVIGKLITIFNETGPEMDQACLVTYLSESLFAPTILLTGDITWEEISDTQVRATITYGGQTASGVFTFNGDHEYIRFDSNDRAVEDGGEYEYIPWSAECDGYMVADNGISYPTTFRAVWHYPEGDFVYFDGEISSISYPG